MTSIKQFEELKAWQKARELVQLIYAASKAGALARDFALCAQMRRAVVAILAGIAEGFERSGDREFAQCLAVAKGSCGEVRAQLYAAADQGYLTAAQFAALLDAVGEVSRLLAGHIRYLQNAALRENRFRTAGAGV